MTKTEGLEPLALAAGPVRVGRRTKDLVKLLTEEQKKKITTISP